MIPFSPPHIDDKIVEEVVAALRSGWITTGPRTKNFEKKLAEYCGVSRVLCVNSASAGLELVLRWFGVGPGDEVIVPAYTYTATAEVVVHCGATPVMVDVHPDFLIDPERVREAITPKTKVIVPVDIAGYPCDYDELFSIVEQPSVRAQFCPANELQKRLGRPLIMADAAHSLGGWYKGRRVGAVADISVFSFHAVKNLTTAEGGAICLHLPAPFDAEEIYKLLCTYSLHGQSKDALAKTQIGNWRYDVIDTGYKCNMTDVAAAMGLVELERYDRDILPRRRAIFEQYAAAFAADSRFQVPEFATADKTSSFHVFALRLRHATEAQRDAVMQCIFEQEVAVNVHFIPLPLLTAYKDRGYDIRHYPVTYDNYAREISLPVYYDLTDEQVAQVITAVKTAADKVVGTKL